MPILMMSYCHTDEVMRDRLEIHLSMLKREGVIETWHDRRIVAGQPLDGSIMAQVAAADIFLCLLSADFIDSHYCYNIEMTRALERHAAGTAVVIPVVLHSCEWRRTPLANLMAVPKDAKPIAKYAYQEDAYLEVVQEIRKAIAAHKQSTVASGDTRASESMVRPRAGQNNAVLLSSVTTTGRSLHPRSSNLNHVQFGNRSSSPLISGPVQVNYSLIVDAQDHGFQTGRGLALRKTFSDADRHTFMEDGFEFIARFFEESLTELQQRNLGVEVKFRRNGADVLPRVPSGTEARRHNARWNWALG